MLPPTDAWKLLLAVVILAAIFLSACAHAPRQSVPAGDLLRLVGASLALFGVGVIATVSHRSGVAGCLYAAGTLSLAFAVWLSRGTDSEDPPHSEEPVDEPPGPDPDGLQPIDWDAFERALKAYVEDRSPTAVS